MISPHEEPRWTIPTQEDRLLNNGYNLWHAVVADWTVVDVCRGDLLYVGKASADLNSRLHPMSHAMWSAVWYNQRYRNRVKIAIWLLPQSSCAAAEAWFTHTYVPLWSDAQTRITETFPWRDPDRVLPLTAFHPYLRRSKHAPFPWCTSAVYAWLLAPQGVTHDVTWVRPLLTNAITLAERIVRKGHRKALPETRMCVCGAQNYATTETCRRCGQNYEEAWARAERLAETQLYGEP